MMYRSWDRARCWRQWNRLANRASVNRRYRAWLAVAAASEEGAKP